MSVGVRQWRGSCSTPRMSFFHDRFRRFGGPLVAAFTVVACSDGPAAGPTGPSSPTEDCKTSSCQPSPPACEAGPSDCNRDYPAPRDVLASTDRAEDVRITWTAPEARRPSGYEIFRDGTSIGKLGADATSLVDAAAELAGPTSLAASTRTRSDGIELTWTPAAGTPHAYTVSAFYDDTASLPSAPSTGRRDSRAVIRYELSRDLGMTWRDAGQGTSFVDTEAPLGSLVAAGTVVAASDLPRGVITLKVEGPAAPTATSAASVEYVVRAVLANGTTPQSQRATGQRGVGTPVYQWQRSAADTDASYADLPGVTGRQWFDPAPQVGVTRFYRATARADGAIPATLTGTSALLSEVKAISAMGTHACALRADGKRVCWGGNTHGEAPPVPSADAFKSIVTGYDFGCGIRLDDKVVCWGSNTEQQAPTAPSADSYKSLSAGGVHTCGIRMDDKIVCWGRNATGEAPPTASTDSFKAVASGFGHTCGIRVDDKVVCWGFNDQNRAPPGPSVDSFKAIAAGNSHTCGLRLADDKRVCWGWDLFGAAPVGPSADSFVALTGGGRHSCALRANGSVSCWGLTSGQTPDDTFKAVSAGYDMTCGLRPDGRVRCWGKNEAGSAPTLPPMGAFTSLDLGDAHACAVRKDGRVVCFGDNDDGKAPMLSTASFTSVAAGRLKTCAIGAGDVSCWGTGAAVGPLATSTAISASGDVTCGVGAKSMIACSGGGEAFDVPSDAYKSVSVGTVAVSRGVALPSFLCAIGSKDELVCRTATASLPSLSLGGTFKAVSSGGANAMCAIRTDGTIACASAGTSSALVPPAGVFTAVAVGATHACGLRSDAKVVCWGSNGLGEAPPEPSVDSFRAIDAGPSFTCGIREDEKLVCWGSDDAGQAPRP